MAKKQKAPCKELIIKDKGNYNGRNEYEAGST